MFTIASIFKHIRFRSADENNWNGVVKLSDHMPLILLKKIQRWIGRMTLLSSLALVNK